MTRPPLPRFSLALPLLALPLLAACGADGPRAGDSDLPRHEVATPPPGEEGEVPPPSAAETELDVPAAVGRLLSTHPADAPPVTAALQVLNLNREAYDPGELERELRQTLEDTGRVRVATGEAPELLVLAVLADGEAGVRLQLQAYAVERETLVGASTSPPAGDALAHHVRQAVLEAAADLPADAVLRISPFSNRTRSRMDMSSLAHHAGLALVEAGCEVLAGDDVLPDLLDLQDEVGGAPAVDYLLRGGLREERADGDSWLVFEVRIQGTVDGAVAGQGSARRKQPR